MLMSMIDAVELLAIGDVPLVTSPHLVANLTYDNLLSKCQTKINFKAYKFITIRPHFQYILGRYFNSVPNTFQYSKKLTQILFDALRTIGLSNSFVTGSVDKNKDNIGTHIHCILECSLRNYAFFKKEILQKLTLDHMMGNKKQYAVVISKCLDKHIDKMVRYYSGIRANAKKAELIYNIIGQGSASDVLPLSEYDAHLLSFQMIKDRQSVKSNRKQTIVEMKNYSELYDEGFKNSKAL